MAGRRLQVANEAHPTPSLKSSACVLMLACDKRRGISMGERAVRTKAVMIKWMAASAQRKKGCLSQPRAPSFSPENFMVSISISISMNEGCPNECAMRSYIPWIHGKHGKYR